MAEIPVPENMNVRAVNLKDGDILMVKQPPGLSKVEEHSFSDKLLDLAEQIASYGVSIIILQVVDFDRLHLVSDEQLAAMGLVRRKDVLAFKSDPFEELVNSWSEESEAVEKLWHGDPDANPDGFQGLNRDIVEEEE